MGEKVVQTRKIFGIILVVSSCILLILGIVLGVWVCWQRWKYANRPEPTYSTDILIDEKLLGDWSVKISVVEPTNAPMLPLVELFSAKSRWSMVMDCGGIRFCDDNEKYYISDEPEQGTDTEYTKMLSSAGDVLEKSKDLLQYELEEEIYSANYVIRQDDYIWAFWYEGNRYCDADGENVFGGDTGILYVYKELEEQIIYAQIIQLEDYCFEHADLFYITVDGKEYFGH